MTILSAQRVALLVDVHNIYYPAKNLGDKVNFHSLLKRFAGRQLVRAIAYVVEAPDADVAPFEAALRNIGFEVKSRGMKVYEDGSRKGDIHLMLALDALSLADRVDAVCLVTGDGEYVDLVHLLRARGVKVEVMSFRSNTSSELMRSADEHIPMGEEFLLGYSGAPRDERGRGFEERGRDERGRGAEDRVRRYDERGRPPLEERGRRPGPRGFESRSPRPFARRDGRYTPRPPLDSERYGERSLHADRSSGEDRPAREASFERDPPAAGRLTEPAPRPDRTGRDRSPDAAEE